MCRVPHFLITHYMIKLAAFIGCIIILLILLRLILLRAHVLGLIHLSLCLSIEHLPDVLLLGIVLSLFEGEDLLKLFLHELKDFLLL
jgi:hypothetical protein